MTFVKGQSGNPTGRPKGPDRYGLALLEKNKRKLLKQLIDKALAGDLKALELCADRLWPKMKSTTRPVEIPLVGSLGGQGQEVLKATMEGRIGTDEANALMAALTAQAKLLEVSELVERVEALEQLRTGAMEVTYVEKKLRTPLISQQQ